VLKTVIQVGDADKLVPAARQVVRSAGLRGLFAGFNATIIRAFPCNAITFYVFEKMMLGYYSWFPRDQ
jgi:hypothetical protein